MPPLFGKAKVEDAPRVRASRYGHLYMLTGALLLFLAAIEVAIQLHGRRAHQHGPFHPPVAGIPRRLHFFWHSNDALPADLERNVESWKTHNPTFSIHVWTPDEMHAYVTRHTPHLVHAYDVLPSAIERADLFRYILLWREGGVYSDVDVLCARPLETYIDLRTDGLVVGWEGDWGSAAACAAAGSARTRVLVQWTMASGPRHPVLDRVLAHVVAHANRTFSANSIRDTHERTGTSAWTDAVLKYAQDVQPGDASMHATAPPVVFLPRAVWGVAEGQVEVGQRSLAHQYLGSWKQVHSGSGPYGDCAVSEFPLAPVTALDWLPRFSILTQASGVGDDECGEDVVASINAYGYWQAGMSPAARPNLQQMVVALLDDAARQTGSPGWFVDVGAGYGLQTLAAASRGYKVLAFEAAPRSLAALQASVAYHGWAEGHVTVLPQPLGNSSEEVCLQRKYPGTNVDEQRGYSRPSQLGDVKSLPQCLSGGQRRMAAEAMGDAVRPHVVRVNANGMEPQVVLGMLPMLKDMGDGMFAKWRRPLALLITWQPAWMEDAASGSVAAMLDALGGAGYTTLALAAPVPPADEKSFECFDHSDLTVTLFGDAASQWRSINWCMYQASDLAAGVGAWRMQDRPRHLVVLHQGFKTTSRHRMRGMGLE